MTRSRGLLTGVKRYVERTVHGSGLVIIRDKSLGDSTRGALD